MTSTAQTAESDMVLTLRLTPAMKSVFEQYCEKIRLDALDMAKADNAPPETIAEISQPVSDKTIADELHELIVTGIERNDELHAIWQDAPDPAEVFVEIQPKGDGKETCIACGAKLTPIHHDESVCSQCGWRS